MTSVEDGIRQVVAAGARLAALGLSPGTSGNLSVLVDGKVLMSPSGSSLSELRPDTVSVLAAQTGELLAGKRPSKEVPLHLALYARDPDARAVVHVHSANAVAASCLPPWQPNCCLPPLTPYLFMKVGQVPLVPYAPPGDSAPADWLRASTLPFRGALLANHGSIVAMPSLDEAIAAAVEIEEAARATLLLMSGSPRLLSEPQVAELASRWGAPWTPAVAVDQA